MNHLPLLQPRPRCAIARQDDPETSHQAAAHVTASGRRDNQAGEVLVGVRLFPGLTSAELADRLPLIDRYAVARRLPELRRLGLVRNGTARPCRITRRRAITWTPAPL